MPQLASLSWFFFSLFFIFFLLFFCVCLWWLNFYKFFSFSSSVGFSPFNSWDW